MAAVSDDRMMHPASGLQPLLVNGYKGFEYLLIAYLEVGLEGGSMMVVVGRRQLEGAAEVGEMMEELVLQEEEKEELALQEEEEESLAVREGELMEEADEAGWIKKVELQVEVGEEVVKEVGVEVQAM